MQKKDKKKEKTVNTNEEILFGKCTPFVCCPPTPTHKIYDNVSWTGDGLRQCGPKTDKPTRLN